MCLFVVCLFGKEPLFRRGYGRGPLSEVPVSHSSSKVDIHPSLYLRQRGMPTRLWVHVPKVSGNGVPPNLG